jgi:hypothetical protein
MVEAEGPIADWRAIMGMAEDYVSQYLAEQPTGGRLQLYKVRRGDRIRRQFESKVAPYHFPFPWPLIRGGFFSFNLRLALRPTIFIMSMWQGKRLKRSQQEAAKGGIRCVEDE